MVGFVSSQLIVNDDLFHGYGGKIQQEVTIGDRKFNIPSSLNNLQVLSNDFIASSEVPQICSSVNQMEVEDFLKLEFKEVAEVKMQFKQVPFSL